MLRYPIIGEGEPKDNRSIPLTTRNKNIVIPNVQEPELAPQQKQASIDLWKRERPDAELRSISGIYNCMGLIFASRRTFVDIGQLEKIKLGDELYQLKNGIREAEVGDIVAYKNEYNEVTHVAMICEIEKDVCKAAINITVISKWGREGEYIHPLDHVPDQFGKQMEYWTDRKI